jgi:phospholipid/cholesterol/gamma-HCH transport system substrate-binding protein
MTPRKRNIIVGTTVLVALLALAWMILQFSSRSFSNLFTKSTPFKIVADRADGLGEGSSVMYLGVPVGRVTSVRRMPDNRNVEIDAILNEGERVPKNVKGYIRPQGALGNAAFIALETVELKTDVAIPPSSELIKAGDTVPAVNRNTGLLPPEFAALARTAQEQKLIQHLDETIIRAGDAMQSFNKLISDKQLRDDLSATLASARNTSDNLQKFTGRLDGLALQTEDTLKSFRKTADISGERVDDLSRKVGDRMTQLGELLEKFNGIALQVEKGEGTLGLLLNDPRLYESFVDTGKTLSLTAGDLRRLVDQWEKEGLTLKLGK